jgi:choline-sulfatase
MKFVDEHKEKPFALLVHFREPHAAYVPMPAPDMATARAAHLQVPDYPGLKEPYTEKARRDYYAAIAALDRNIGRLLAHLEETGLAGRTIVTFTSDHGYNVGEHGMQHKGNGRWITVDRFNEPRPNMFDTSLRTPLIVRWPGRGKAGTVVEDWVTNADMGATVLGMLGLAKPAGALAQSRDYSAALRGEPLPRAVFPKELFGQYDLVNYPIQPRMRMIRTERWKLILFLNMMERSELYDLAADPGESANLYGRAGTQEAVRELTAKLRTRMEAIRDPALAALPL